MEVTSRRLRRSADRHAMISAPRHSPKVIAALALLALMTALFSPALFSGRILAPLDITTRLLAPWNLTSDGAKPHNHNPSDAVTQYLPYRIHAARSLEEDGYIGWNPYTMGGSNLAANTMALPASWTMQLHRFLGFKDAWNLGIYFEFLIAGFGMLVFLRSRNLPWIACLIASVAYMANSQFIIWVYHRWALSSFCWMPWVLWASGGTLTRKDLGVRQCLLPFFLALAVLGGTLQHLVFVGLACGCLLGAKLTEARTVAGRWQAFAVWSAAGILALGMAAFSLVPQVTAYLGNIEIGHVRGGIGYADGKTQPLLNLFAIPAQVWPWLLGDPQTLDAWKLLKSHFMSLAYFGTIPTVLAIAGLFIKGMPRPAKWLIVAGLLIPLTPLVGPLYHRVQLLFLLGGAWMAAEMIAMLGKVPRPRLVKIVALATVSVGVLLLAGALLPSGARGSIENEVVTRSLEKAANSQFGDDPAWIESRARAWTDRFSLFHPRTLWVYGLLCLGSGGLILVARSQRASGPPWGALAILGATSLELATLFQTWTTFSDPSALTPPHPLVEEVREMSGSHRVLQGFGSHPITDLFAAPNLLSAYMIPAVDAYESIQYRSTFYVLRELAPMDRLTLAGVGLSVQPSGTPPIAGTASWPLARSGPDFEIRRNPVRLAAILGVREPMPPQASELLPVLVAAQPVAPETATMNRWKFRWPQDAPWVRLAQNWHPGWRWKSAADGEWKELVNGPDGTCWIGRPAGAGDEIEVRFFAVPPAIRFASIGSGIFALILLLARGVSARSFSRPV